MSNPVKSQSTIDDRCFPNNNYNFEVTYNPVYVPYKYLSSNKYIRNEFLVYTLMQKELVLKSEFRLKNRFWLNAGVNFTSPLTGYPLFLKHPVYIKMFTPTAGVKRYWMSNKRFFVSYGVNIYYHILRITPPTPKYKPLHYTGIQINKEIGWNLSRHQNVSIQLPVITAAILIGEKIDGKYPFWQLGIDPIAVKYKLSF